MARGHEDEVHYILSQSEQLNFRAVRNTAAVVESKKSEGENKNIKLERHLRKAMRVTKKAMTKT